MVSSIRQMGYRRQPTLTDMRLTAAQVKEPASVFDGA